MQSTAIVIAAGAGAREGELTIKTKARGYGKK